MYIRQYHPEDVAVCHKLDNAVATLLITGSIPSEVDGEENQASMNQPSNPGVPYPVPPKLDEEAATSIAIAFLKIWC